MATETASGGSAARRAVSASPRVRLARFCDLGDEAEPVRVTRAELVAKQDQLLRARRAEQLREPHRAAGAEQDPDPHLGQAERGGIVNGALRAHLVPLSLAWIDERVVIAVGSDSVTARNIREHGTARLGLGPTRDAGANMRGQAAQRRWPRQPGRYAAV